ncbi:MAG: competence protein ComEC family protein [Bacteroidota bacterium]|nr:competence protein ComEC family protein [Bacteroidota bacterium]
MINLRNSPFLWLSFVLLSAICLSGHIPEISWQVQIVLLSTCGITTIFSLLKYTPAKQYLSTIAIALLIFCAGLLRVNEFHQSLYPDDQITDSEYFDGVVMVRQVLKNKVDAVTLKCEQVSLEYEKDSIRNAFTDRYILVYIKTAIPLSLLPGDHIGVQGYVNLIKPPMNPYSFDAGKYYNTVGIRYNMYCKSEDVQTGFPSHFSIARMTAQWQYFLSSMVRGHTSPEVAQLTNALVWGDRSDMDEEVRDAFADSGAMHVLSVSGMHVAIVYSMLLYILGAPGTGSLLQRLIRFGIYTIAILLYVGLSGAGPAVVRAGLMIILFLFGKSMGWNTQIWNLLGFAAFMMFWLNPFIWENIGFQLSFLAMAGILLFAKPVIRWLSFKNKILHIIWEITALSITAQIFILPVLLGQFHQFPLTFIISSIVAIPASYLVMGGALLNVLLSLMGIDLMWPLVDWSGHYFIVAMKWISELNPLMHYSLPSLAGILMMSMAILYSFGVVFKWHQGKWIGYSLGLMTMLTLSCHRIKEWKHNEILIYHCQKGLLMDIVSEGQCISIQDPIITNSAIEFIARGYRCHKDIISSTQLYINQDFISPVCQYQNNHLQIAGSSLLIYNESDLAFHQVHCKWFVISNVVYLNKLKEALCNTSFDLVIFPAHLPKKISKPIIKFCRQNDLPYYDIATVGYYRNAL